MSGGRGAGDRPVTYAGAYDATTTYLPREVVTDAGLVYMAIARSTGNTPATTPASWMALGSAGRAEFSMAGTLSVATSPPWVARASGLLTQVRCLLGTAGSSSTVVTVYKNAVSIGTVTLTSGQTNVAATFSTAFAADTDLLTVGVTTVGTGAANLTVLGRMS